jgi:hypothetical protein
MLPFRTVRGAAVAALALTAFASSGALHGALAAEPKVLGSFKDWNAFAFDEGGHKVCYMSSQPKKKEPAGAKRGDIYVLVTHRPGEKSFDVVSFIAGYSFKKESEAVVELGGKTVKLFTDGETAWARDADTDKSLVAGMKDAKGKPMVMKGVSGRGTKTTDTYSLDGVTEAYNAINVACGVKK